MFRSQFSKFSEKNQGRGFTKHRGGVYNTCNTLHADVAFPTSFSIVRLAFLPTPFWVTTCESAEDVRWMRGTSIGEEVENTGKIGQEDMSRNLQKSEVQDVRTSQEKKSGKHRCRERQKLCAKMKNKRSDRVWNIFF